MVGWSSRMEAYFPKSSSKTVSQSNLPRSDLLCHYSYFLPPQGLSFRNKHSLFVLTYVRTQKSPIKLDFIELSLVLIK